MNKRKRKSLGRELVELLVALMAIVILVVGVVNGIIFLKSYTLPESHPAIVALEAGDPKACAMSTRYHIRSTAGSEPSSKIISAVIAECIMWTNGLAPSGTVLGSLVRDKASKEKAIELMQRVSHKGDLIPTDTPDAAAECEYRVDHFVYIVSKGSHTALQVKKIRNASIGACLIKMNGLGSPGGVIDLLTMDSDGTQDAAMKADTKRIVSKAVSLS